MKARLTQTGRWSWTATVERQGSIVDDDQVVRLMLDPFEFNAFGWRAEQRALRKARRFAAAQQADHARWARYRSEATEVDL